MDEDVRIAMDELSKAKKKAQPSGKRTPQKNPRFVPPFEFLTIEDVSEVTRFSKSMIYRLIRTDGPYYDPTFPSPLQVGSHKVMWRSDELSKWMLGLKRAVLDEADFPAEESSNS